ncbi:MAG: DUF2062 domain-containing protein [Pseudomonadota bacterium]
MLEQKVEISEDTIHAAASADVSIGSTARKGWIERIRRMVYDSFITPLVSSRNPPWYDARAVSLGLVVGFAVPVGAQFIALGFLRSFLRFNFIVALGFSLVSNPFNMIPLYYGYYLLGAFVLGRNGTMDFSVFQKLMHPITDSTYFWEATVAFANLSMDFLVCWGVAALILSVTFGILGYMATYKIQQVRCSRKARKMGLKYEKFLQDLEDKLNRSPCSLPTGSGKRR